jgi:hypothetical protein
MRAIVAEGEDPAEVVKMALATIKGIYVMASAEALDLMRRAWGAAVRFVHWLCPKCFKRADHGRTDPKPAQRLPPMPPTPRLGHAPPWNPYHPPIPPPPPLVSRFDDWRYRPRRVPWYMDDGVSY